MMDLSDHAPPPTTIAAAATLACIWEATAPKPGNVYRGADFVDLTYVDLLTCAALAGPILSDSKHRGVGATILEAVEVTKRSVGGNANLGILLLLAPLAACDAAPTLQATIATVLQLLNETDAEQAYAAIRLAQPGGLGSAPQADVREKPPAGMTLVDAMRMAAGRDLIARQYAHQFCDVLTTADRIAKGASRHWPLADAIVHSFLQLNAEHPDTLIARKCGQNEAQRVARRCQSVLDVGQPGETAYQAALADLDFYLRCDGNRRNPGASADVIAAALFVLLRENRLNWPVRFYG